MSEREAEKERRGNAGGREGGKGERGKEGGHVPGGVTGGLGERGRRGREALCRREPSRFGLRRDQGPRRITSEWHQIKNNGRIVVALVSLARQRGGHFRKSKRAKRESLS